MLKMLNIRLLFIVITTLGFIACSDMKVEFSNLGPDTNKKDPVSNTTHSILNAEILVAGGTLETVNKTFRVTSNIQSFGNQLFYESTNKKFKVYLSQQGTEISETGGSK